MNNLEKIILNISSKNFKSRFPLSTSLMNLAFLYLKQNEKQDKNETQKIRKINSNLCASYHQFELLLLIFFSKNLDVICQEQQLELKTFVRRFVKQSHDSDSAGMKNEARIENFNNFYNTLRKKFERKLYEKNPQSFITCMISKYLNQEIKRIGNFQITEQPKNLNNYKFYLGLQFILNSKRAEIPKCIFDMIDSTFYFNLLRKSQISNSYKKQLSSTNNEIDQQLGKSFVSTKNNKLNNSNKTITSISRIIINIFFKSKFLNTRIINKIGKKDLIEKRKFVLDLIDRIQSSKMQFQQNNNIDEFSLCRMEITKIKCQTHLFQKLIQKISDSIFEEMNFKLIGGGINCSNCNTTNKQNEVVINTEHSVPQNRQNDDEKLEKYKQLIADYNKKVIENNKTISKIEYKFNKQVQNYANQQIIIGALNDTNMISQILKLIIDECFVRFQESLCLFKREKILELLNIVINLLFALLSKSFKEDLKDTIQSNINDLTTKLQRVLQTISNQQDFYPSLDIKFLFEIIINLNKQRKGYDEQQKNLFQKILEYSIIFIKYTTSVSKITQYLKDQNLNEIGESISNILQFLINTGEQFDNIQKALEENQIESSNDTIKLFNFLNTTQLHKVKEIIECVRNKEEFTPDKELIYYIKIFNSFSKETSDVQVKLILLQIQIILQNKKDYLNKIIKTNKDLKDTLLQFVEILQFMKERKNEQSIYEKLINIFKEDDIRYFIIQLLIEFIEMDSLFSEEEKESLMEILSLKYTTEKQQSILIVFQRSKQFREYVLQIVNNDEKQKKIKFRIEKFNKQMLSYNQKQTQNFLLEITKVKNVKELIVEKFNQILTINNLQIRDLSLIQHKDDSLFDMLDIYIQQSLSFIKGNNILKSEQYEEQPQSQLLLNQTNKKVWELPTWPSQNEDDFNKESIKNQLKSIEYIDELSQNNQLIENNYDGVRDIIQHFIGQTQYSTFQNKSDRCNILSIVGEGGTGKSMFLKKLEIEIIKYNDIGNTNIKSTIMPLMIKCSSLNIDNPSITSYLKQMYNSEFVDFIKKSECNKLIMLDGYDEYSGQYFKIYEKLNLHEWENTLVIVSSRLEKIKKEDAEIYFNYYDENGKIGNEKNQAIYKLNSFSQENVIEYFKKFMEEQKLKNKNINPIIQNMEQSIFLNRNLNKILKLPINIYLLSHMVIQINFDDSKLQEILVCGSDQIDIYEVFFQFIFQKKAQEIVDKQSTVFLDKDVDSVRNYYFEYFQKMAMMMFLQKKNSSNKPQQEELNKQNYNFLQLDRTLLKKQFLTDKKVKIVLSDEIEKQLIDSLDNLADERIITKVKFSHKSTAPNSENINQQMNQEENLIEFRHKSIFEYFAARAMKYDFDIYQEKIHQLKDSELEQFDINQKIIMSSGNNQSESQILLNLYKLINNDMKKCDYTQNYTQNDNRHNNRFFQYIKRSNINSINEVSTIDTGASNLISALFLSKFSFVNLKLTDCSITQAYILKERELIEMKNCNLSSALLRNINLSSLKQCNTTQSTFDTFQKLFDSSTIYQFKQMTFFNDSLVTINDSGYINQFKKESTLDLALVDNQLNQANKDFSLVQSKLISDQPLTTISVISESEFLISTSKYIYIVDSQSFQIKDRQSLENEIIDISFNQKGNFILIFFKTNKSSFFNLSTKQFDDSEFVGQKAVFSHNGDKLIIINQKQAKIYSIDPNQYIEKVEPIHEIKENIRSAIFSYDDQQIISLSVDQIIKAIFWENGKIIKPSYNNQNITLVSVSSDGKYFATVYKNYCKIWECEDPLEFKECISEINHNKDIQLIVFSPDSKRLVTYSIDNVCKVIEIGQLNSKESVIQEVNYSYSISFSSSLDSNILAASFGETCQIWEKKNNGFYELKQSLNEHKNIISSIDFSQDGNYLATASQDKSCVIWNANNFSKINVITQDHIIRAVTFSSDSSYLALGTDKTYSIYERNDNFNQPLETQKFNSPVNSIAFSENKKYFASSDGSNCRVWNIDQEFKQIDKRIYNIGTIRSIAFSPNNKYLATGSDDNLCIIWETNNFQRLKEILCHQNPILSVTFSPNSNFLVTATLDNTCKIWDVQKYFCFFHEIKNSISRVTYSKNGKYLATIESNRSVKIWNSQNFYEIISMQDDQTQIIVRVAFSANNQYLATGCLNGSCNIWNASKGFEVINGFQHHNSEITSMTFSSDTRYFATCSKDLTYKMYNIKLGFSLITINISEASPIYSVAFSIRHEPVNFYQSNQNSQEQRNIFALGLKNDIKILEEVNNQFSQKNTLPHDQADILTFSSTGEYLASAGTFNYQGECKIWRFDDTGFKYYDKFQSNTKIVQARFSLDVDNNQYITISAIDKTIEILIINKQKQRVVSHMSIDEKKLTPPFTYTKCRNYLILTNNEYKCELRNCSNIKQKELTFIKEINNNNKSIIKSLDLSSDDKYLAVSIQQICKIWRKEQDDEFLFVFLV